MSITLTKDGIPKLLNQQRITDQDILIQVLNVKAVKKEVNYFPCNISDGYRKIKAALSTNNQKFNPQTHNFGLILIKKHSVIRVNDSIRGVQIQQYQIQGPYPQIIGDPVNYSAQAQLSEHATNFIDIDKMKAKNSKKKPIQIIKEEPQKKQIVLTIDQPQDDSVTDITMRRLKDSDKISDLYVDLPNWEIVCRISDKNYKEFVSKKSGKFTQILTLQLMDRTGMKIQGTAFGEYSKQLDAQLSLNNLYRISKGQIKQQTYNSNKGPKYSRFNIIFSKNSIFRLLKDTQLIPKFRQDAYASVKSVIGQKDFQKQYDVAAILTDVGEQKTISDKNGQPLTKRVISVSDPQSNQTIQVTLWRDIKFDQSWLGKTILLKNFKLNKYMNNISLNSLFKSQIKLLQNHRYNSHQGNIQTQKFTQVSASQTVQQNQNLKTIKQLQSDCAYLNDGDVIQSTINAYVTLMSFKNKWFYQSCPKCKKGGAQSNTQCVSCNVIIEQPISRFILPIQIADFTASLWTTAFDQFANVLLQNKSINELKYYDQVRLREEGQRKVFKQFRFKISTKKQFTGQIKHTIQGKPSQINPEKCANENIQKIYQYE